MGVSLYFDAIGPVDPATADAARSAIEAAVDRLGGRQPWIGCEPPHAFPVGEDGRLVVGSKLNLLPSPGEQEELRESPAEEPDLIALLRILAGVSAETGVDWAARIERDPIGRIVSGSCDDGLRGAIDTLSSFPDSLDEPDADPSPEGPPALRIWPGPEATDE